MCDTTDGVQHISQLFIQTWMIGASFNHHATVRKAGLNLSQEFIGIGCWFGWESREPCKGQKRSLKPRWERTRSNLLNHPFLLGHIPFCFGMPMASHLVSSIVSQFLYEGTLHRFACIFFPSNNPNFKLDEVKEHPDQHHHYTFVPISIRGMSPSLQLYQST